MNVSIHIEICIESKDCHDFHRLYSTEMNPCRCEVPFIALNALDTDEVHEFPLPRHTEHMLLSNTHNSNNKAKLSHLLHFQLNHFCFLSSDVH